MSMTLSKSAIEYTRKGENKMSKLCDICERELGHLCADGLYRCWSCLDDVCVSPYAWDEEDDPREEAFTDYERNPGFRSW